MPKTYEPIASTTVGTATTTVTLSNIPQTYTDLVVVANAATPSGGIVFSVRFNSDTGSNYSGTRLGGTGTATFSDRSSSATSIGATILKSSAQPDGAYIIHIQNYANTNTYKTCLIRGNATQVGVTAGLWRSTSAITSVSFGGEFTADVIAGSTFVLYGIKAA
jgi:hypothetical protein